MTGLSRRELLKGTLALLCSAGLPVAAGASAAMHSGQPPVLLLTLADPRYDAAFRAAQQALSASAPCESHRLEASVWGDLPSLQAVFQRAQKGRLVALVDDRAALLIDVLLSDRAPLYRHRSESRLDLRRTDGALALSSALAGADIGAVAAAATGVVPGADRLVTLVIDLPGEPRS